MGTDKNNRRVVITGIGLVTPLGTGLKKTWDALCAGKSGIKEISKIDTLGLKTKIAGEVKDFDPADFLSKKEVKITDPFVAYSVGAAKMALTDSNMSITNLNADRIGVIIGCGFGGVSTIEKALDPAAVSKPFRLSPFFVPMIIGNMASGMISIHLGAKGPNSHVGTACAAGTHAIGDSFEIIKRGDADAMIAGGVEAPITKWAIAAFNSMRVLSKRNSEPEKASRPFDRDRDGFVIGEGSGIVILELLESAMERGARIYAEICGYGMGGEGRHITAPDPEGNEAARCMKLAIKDAGISINDIDYINAHGTGTRLNDVSETNAIKKVFKDKAGLIPISSTKSMTGHLLGGAGGIETIFTALAIYSGIIPPTINLDNPDNSCYLDYVPNTARKKNISFAIKNSFGFGGANACLVLKRFTD